MTMTNDTVPPAGPARLLAVPTDPQLEHLAADAARDDLAGKDVDTLADEARWHKRQADHHQERALFHWLECGRRLLAMKAQLRIDHGTESHGMWLPAIRDEVGLPERTAQEMMYLARNPLRVADLLVRDPGVSVRGALREITTAVQIEKHAKEPRVIPWVANMPPGVEIEEADAAALPLPDGLVDLIMTSPPYNLSKVYGAGIDDDSDYIEYLAMIGCWAREMYRVCGPNGRIAINVPLDTMLGGTPRPVYANWLALLAAAGFSYRTSIVWNEGNVTRSNARGSIASPSSPYVAAPVEMVLWMHKGDWRVIRPGAVSDLTKEESIAWQGPAAGLWTFNGTHNPDHPAPFPPELPRRCIKLMTYLGDVVCDPFVGSGTTAAVASQLGRTCYAFDISARNVALAREAVANQEKAA